MISSEVTDESSLIGGIGAETEMFFAITWERVRSASDIDDTIQMLISLILEGFPVSKKDLPAQVHQYWEARDQLNIFDGVVLYNDRIVIPPALRPKVIENLHSAHQGVSSMFCRAQAVVFWPGMTADIEESRNQRRTCHRNAPSQAKLPPTAPKIQTTPFETIYAGYFQLVSKHYLIVGNRLSGWTEVVKTDPGTSSSGSKGLCEALRKVFMTFGVPEEISSDGGPEFVSGEAEDFYHRWGIKHRLSSAYFPQSNGRA
jgi:hypothetical protein